MKKKRQEMESGKNYQEKNKSSVKTRWILFLMVGIFIIGTVLLIFTSRVLGFVNNYLGKDIIIKVDSEKTDFFINHGESENVTFEILMQGNSLCSAKCDYRFWDISRNKTIETNNFTLGIIPLNKEFILEPKHLGTGQELYRFDLKCRGIYTFVCHTSERLISKNILITLGHDLNEEEIVLKHSSLERLDTLVSNLSGFYSRFLSIVNTTAELDSFIIIDSKNETEKAGQTLTDVEKNMHILETIWKEQDYYSLDSAINTEEMLFKDFEDSLFLLENRTNESLFKYNLIVEKLYSAKQMLSEIRNALILNKTNFSKKTELNQTISEFNSALKNLGDRGLLEREYEIADIIFNKTYSLYEEFIKISLMENQSQINETGYNTIDEINLTKIQPVKQNFTYEMIFQEPSEKCCLYGECGDCCLYGDCIEKNLPIVFVHGHDFSKYSPAEYNLDSQNKIEENLESKGNFLNAGVISIISNQSDYDIWGKANIPFMIKLSYYFDVKSISSIYDYVLVQTKDENITEYSKRLNKLIEIVKYKTGKPKVNIVAYSMGGLVSRRYLQIYGQESVSKLILVAVPNHGLVGEISSFCPIIGEKKECIDMKANSTFMKELEKASKPTIPTYNIIGTGCKMLNGLGDGIVLEKNARLEGAESYLVKGDCSKGIMHTQINDPSIYPKTYDVIRDILEE